MWNPELLLGASLLVGLLLSLEFGRWVGLRVTRKQAGERPDEGVGPLDAAAFALVGLLIAFCFGGAASRFETRRDMITTHANSIGTAWLRIDLLPADTQPALRQAFRECMDQLLAARKISDRDQPPELIARYHATSSQIWRLAVAAVERDSRPQTATLVLPAVNQMLDDGTTRLALTRLHQPKLILPLMVGSLLVAAFIGGLVMYKASRLRWAHALTFAIVSTSAVVVTYDLEYPRSGFIRLDAEDQVMVDLRASFDAP